MDNDFNELLSLFDRCGVRYLIVGGYAVIFHAQPRGTKDLDLFIEPERKNAEAVFHALALFGAPLAGFTVEDFQDASSVYQIGQPPLRIDLIKSLEGITFQQAWESRIQVTEDGIPMNYISREDLITNKLATGRLQDLADVQSVRDAAKADPFNPDSTDKTQ
jgi:predicted nucleotidyltransferase